MSLKSSSPGNPEPGKPIKLMKSNIDRIEQPGTYPDTEITGFRLWVGKSGAKSYQMVGKVKGQPRPVYVTIGKHGDPWTPDAARKEAECIRLLMRQGVNPNEQSKEKQRAEADRAEAESAKRKLRELTVRTGFEKHLEKGHKESTVRGYKKVINAHLKDWLDKPLIDISQANIIERFDKISLQSPSNAAHAMRLLKAIFSTVQITCGPTFPELANHNPTKILKHARPSWNSLEARDDYIPDEDLPSFYKAVLSLTSTTARDYLMVCILTGLRKTEVCTLTWAKSIDLRKKVITVDDTKNKQRHMLAMSDYLYQLFLRRWHMRDSDFVFPGKSKAGCYDDPEKSINHVIKTAGIESFSSHALRRTFATAADAVGYDLRSIQRLLNHKPGSVADKHYIQRHAEKTREPMQRINDRLLTLMGAKGELEPTENIVVPLINKSVNT